MEAEKHALLKDLSMGVSRYASRVLADPCDPSLPPISYCA